MKNGLNTAVSSKILKQNAQTSAMILLLPWTKRNYTKFSAQRCISVSNFISVAQPQNFGNKRFDERSRLVTCITTADAIRETPQPQTLGKRRLLRRAESPTEPPQPTWPTKHNSRGNQQRDVWWNKNLQIDKKPKEWKQKSAKIHVTLNTKVLSSTPQHWGTDTELMISSGANESSTSRDTDSVVRIKCNYTKFSSATEAHFCIKLHQCGSTPKFGNKTFDDQSRLATCMPLHNTTQQLMQSERHPSRKHQAKDACWVYLYIPWKAGVPHRSTSADMADETQQPRASGKRCLVQQEPAGRQKA